MEEQLIGFETAKLAKEKGFNWNTGKSYMSNGILFEHEIVQHSGEHFPFAPTQSLLQKWLREVHDIYVESYHDYDPKDGKYQYYTNWGFNDPNTIEKKQSGWYDEYNDWKTYEDALEFGLKEGLKMIKIAEKEIKTAKIVAH